MTKPRGVKFQIVPPSPPDKLARMDVAAFVGFAASGPVDTPVAVADPIYFQEIFGPDQALAWDPVQGQPLYSYLGPAVRAFFRNGGERCWVVRVAKKPVTNHFPVPGLMQASSDGYRGVELQARSPGSWSDKLRVGTVLDSAGVGRAEFEHDFAATPSLYVPQRGRTPIRPGDLLRVWFKDRLLLYFAVTEAAELAEPLRQEDAAATTRWRLRGLDYWFRSARGAAEGQPAHLEKGAAFIRRLDPPGATNDADAIWQNCEGWWFPPGQPNRPFFVLPAPALLRPGNLIQVEHADRELRLLLSAAELETEVHDADPPRYNTRLTAWDALQPLERSDGRALAEGGGEAECLTMTLWVADAHGRTVQSTGLGFTPGHRRFLGKLPTDEALFRPVDERAPLPDGSAAGGALWEEVAYPRFPVAAIPVAPALAGEQVMLPIGMDAVMRTEWAGTAAPQGRTMLERDGLGCFDMGVFLDRDLEALPTATLLGAAVTKRHVQMQKLQGVHAVLPLDEVTLVCLPDLVHTGWMRHDVPGLPPQTAPTLAVGAGAPPGQVRLTWDAPEPAKDYLLQSAADVDFTQCAESQETRETSRDLPAPGEAGGHGRYCRVRARSAQGAGPWSNTVMVHFPRMAFQPTQRLATPDLKTAGVGHLCKLSWTLPDNATSLLQSSADPDFSEPATLYAGAANTCTVLRTGYYRVRAYRDGEATPWSTTVAPLPALTGSAAQAEGPVIPWRANQLTPAAIRKDHLSRAAVHRAVLRLCQARGDLFAVLSLPAAYRENDAVAYIRALATVVGAGEEPALSYGALYYPSLVLETSPGEQRVTPPDGPVTGLIAGLSLSQGVWLPPAYKRLTGVAGLEHNTLMTAYPLLLEEGINVIVHRPDGILVRSAQTLSLDASLQPINVRRLLMLIRRRALREGNYLVFEPNSEAFRRAAERRFERMLTDLFVQGAFAGSTPAESFKVSIDPAVNTPEAREQGRLVIDLAVAPMQPLVFMTVRVMQAEGREPVFSEGSV